ncbi:MAG: 16S rRNA (cytidine(1402)-2'-O)-methyltransferase [Deltaproteobacteria bacterium]|nr:MAG: 16S rRNA (cytidine(1402)-2'-O)-methyltransferase [Deltaproteobacteria bacterium]
MPGTLYVVATPIGNLEDITARALRVLREVAVIAAEDTRHSRKLLNHFGIRTPLISCHEHNEQQRQELLLGRLLAGEAIALISDAGTPAIADPGYRLVRACHGAGVPVVPIPGASALLAALSAAGEPTDRFLFEGFLPARATAREAALRALCGEPRTVVCYEAPHRLMATLAAVAAVWGADRPLVVARELTKLHEELFRGTVGEALAHFGAGKVRGELVLILPPCVAAAPERDLLTVLRETLAAGTLPRKAVVKQVAKEFGVASDEVYRLSLEIGRDENEGRPA